jgi:glycoside hydrolase-like protein
MRPLRLSAVAAILSLAILVAPAAAHGDARTIHFRGHEVRLPADWPVYRLAAHPRMCVRLDRRAVYLGTPDANQRCPASAIGRRRAILVDPASSARATTSATSAPAHLSTVGDFTGLGFDACTAPSSRTMSAWASSPYRAVGVYIGGANRACSQPNLTAAWVGEQLAAEWHPIPTYVGLQAPTSSCGSCAKLSSTLATPQGTAAAEDAVADAQDVGIGPGSPIYFDMEAYTRTASASKATLTFLAAWTTELHALGYVSGVYSSSASGIADLAGQIGTGYPLPDDLWIANWNGQQSTIDPYVPATAWNEHQRIHQYRGGHNETYGGVTINIDNNYVEGATVGAASARPALPPLTVKHVRPIGGTVRVWVRCGWPGGETCPGQIVLRSHVRVPAHGRTGVRAPKTRLVRLAVGRRGFRLAGGRSHTFRIALNTRGRPLLHERGSLKAQLLVAIPGARATRAVQLRRAR